MRRSPFIISALCCIYSAQAFAAGGASYDGAEHGKASSGLPQLDPSSYASQTFWLVVVFTLMYFFFARKSLPEIASTIENRAERINNDLDSAQRIKEEVDAVQKSYEESLNKSRDIAASLFKKIEQETKAKSEENTKNFQIKSAERIAEMETNISAARKTAIEQMSDVAAEVAAEAAEKIIGVRTDTTSAKAVVESLNKAA